MLGCLSQYVSLCTGDRTRGLILFFLQHEQCHIVVLDRFSPQPNDSKPRGCTEPLGRMESRLVRVGVVRVGGSQQQTWHRIYRANKAFKLITTAVYLRRGLKKKGKNADGQNPFSWYLRALEMCFLVCVCVRERVIKIKRGQTTRRSENNNHMYLNTFLLQVLYCNVKHNTFWMVYKVFLH